MTVWYTKLKRSESWSKESGAPCTIKAKFDISNMSFIILHVNYSFERIVTQN